MLTKTEKLAKIRLAIRRVKSGAVELTDSAREFIDAVIAENPEFGTKSAMEGLTVGDTDDTREMRLRAAPETVATDDENETALSCVSPAMRAALDAETVSRPRKKGAFTFSNEKQWGQMFAA